MFTKLLADIVAVIHGLLAVYVAVGAVLIVIGLWRRWEFARNFAFRYSHLLLCLGVNVFEWANLPCPLTSLEWYLRERSNEPSGFIQHYVTESIHVNVEPGVLTRLTLPLLLLMTALYIWAGPRPIPEDELPDQPNVDTPTRPRAWRTAGVMGCLLLCAIWVGIPVDWLTSKFSSSSENWHNFFFLIALTLCLVTPRACGLGLGPARQWRRHALAIAVILAIPPLAVATVYAHYTSKPFENFPASNWLVGSIAQEFLFAGFIYARLCELWGAPGENWRAAFAWPMLITPVLFAIWHWPNATWLSSGYFALMCVYTLLGGWWMLNLRRWTGSIWPGAVLHVVVNYFAAKV